jgi:hypothetical protein
MCAHTKCCNNFPIGPPLSMDRHSIRAAPPVSRPHNATARLESDDKPGHTTHR